MASAQWGKFWAAFNLLIVDPLATVGSIWYLWAQIKGAVMGGLQIANLGSTLKYFAIGLAVKFTLSSLSLLYYLWKVSSLQSQIAKIRAKINRLESRR